MFIIENFLIMIIILLLSYFNEIYTEYKEIFFDDFLGTELNNEIWSINNNVTHCSPCELQLYLTNNVIINNGYLTIITKRENAISANNQKFEFTSGWISTKNKFSFLQGKIQIRAKLPSPEATGSWPAHWLLPQSTQCWPIGGEIDIMEATASVTQNYRITGSYRWGVNCTEDEQILPGAVYPAATDSIIDFSKDFHVFSVEWTTTELIFSVDDNIYEIINNNDVIFPTFPMYIILNTAVAWYMPPGPKAIYPTTHIIDWVKISQNVIN